MDDKENSGNLEGKEKKKRRREICRNMCIKWSLVSFYVRFNHSIYH